MSTCAYQHLVLGRERDDKEHEGLNKRYGKERLK
jgi:hypothetical protein